MFSSSADREDPDCSRTPSPQQKSDLIFMNVDSYYLTAGAIKTKKARRDDGLFISRL